MQLRSINFLSLPKNLRKQQFYGRVIDLGTGLYILLSQTPAVGRSQVFSVAIRQCQEHRNTHRASLRLSTLLRTT